MKKIYLLLLLAFLYSSTFAGVRIVVLGSSTSASALPNSWVKQYEAYLKTLDSSSQIINLAQNSYTTYHVMGDGFTPEASLGARPVVDTERNITKALSHSPDAIIINLPTNDVANDYTNAEQMANYASIVAEAGNVPVWITTSQPRNFESAWDGGVTLRARLYDMYQQITNIYGVKSIDFWTEIADTDYKIKTEYDNGDHIHLNAAGHNVLYQQVLANAELETLVQSLSSATKIINIDFGHSTRESDSPWNNMTIAYTAGTNIPDLTYDDGTNSGISIELTTRFWDAGVVGPGYTATTPSFPENATVDAFIGSSTFQNGKFTLSGLEVGRKYSFSIFSSRWFGSDVGNRDTDFKVTGETEETVYCDAVDNTTNVVSVENMLPAADGTITITVSAGTNNTSGEYYINAMQIAVHEMETPVLPVNSVSIDFGYGGATFETPSPWNNLTNATTGSISDLIKEDGASTGISIAVTGGFAGINAFGETATNTILLMPESASKDAFYGSGDAGGGFSLSGLNPEYTYSFHFYGSRVKTAPTDETNRNTKFTVTGLNSGNGEVNATGNTSNIVSILNITPAADGTVSILLEKGTGSGFFYINAMRIDLPEITPPQETLPEESINVDFGSVDNQSPLPWNNLTSYTTGASISNLINGNEVSTGISISITAGFTGVNWNGPVETTSSMLMPPNASFDAFYGDNSTSLSTLLLSNLDLNKIYTFSFFGSRAGVSDNRDVEYIVTGANSGSAVRNASSNTGNIAKIENIAPLADGTISVTIQKGINNQTVYYYLNAMQILPAPNIQTGNNNVNKEYISVYPNPHADGFYVKGIDSGFTDIKIIDMLGHVLYADNVFDNHYVSTSNLPKGIYIVRLATIDGFVDSKIIKQ